jgi:hypothetical protein
MLKHVGRHGDRKVAILFREVPGEEHMCLVVYPETMPTHIHNSIMSTLESAPGQAATNLSEVLHRSLLPDGRAQLEALHREGMIKKIPTNQVIVTPTPQSNVKLDEMNKIIREMEQGGEALKRLQELDASAGIVDPAQKRKAEAEYKRREERAAQDTRTPYVPPLQSPDGALDDKTLAANMLAQAKRMEIEAKGMIAEAARMKKEAQNLNPNVNVSNQSAPAATPATVTPTAPRKGRPPKSKVATADAVQ